MLLIIRSGVDVVDETWQVLFQMRDVWIGVYTVEDTEFTSKSCLSHQVQKSLRDRIQNKINKSPVQVTPPVLAVLAVPAQPGQPAVSVVPAVPDTSTVVTAMLANPTIPVALLREDLSSYIHPYMGTTIDSYLKNHPLIAFVHTQGIKEAKDILCAWYATENITPQSAPVSGSFDNLSWNNYFDNYNQVRKLGIPTPHYKMHFYVNDENKCYSVTGPRDTMLALFGWNAKISDEALDIDLKYKVDLDYDSFLKVHIAVDYAESCQHFQHGYFPP